MDTPQPVVIDAALRFARTNPDLVRYAQEHAGTVGVSVDDLLLDAIHRVVAIRRAERRALPPRGSGVERPLVALVPGA